MQGIGTEDGSPSNKHTAAANGKGLQIGEFNSSLKNPGDYLFAGHASKTNGVTTSDLDNFVAERWQRSWYVQKSGAVDATLSFDFAAAGLTPPVPTSNSSHYKLLFRSNLSNIFQIVNVKATVNGSNQIDFMLSDNTLQNGYYTIGYSDAILWTGEQNEKWNNGANWSSNTVPTNTSSVIVDHCATCLVLSNSVTLSTISILSSTLTLGAHSLTVSGDVSILGSTVNSQEGVLEAFDFEEVKQSHFNGTILFRKSGNINTTWYGGNEFNAQAKFINLSASDWKIANAENNVMK